MDYVMVGIIFVLGVIIGVGIASMAVKDAMDGDLIVVEDTDGDEPYIFLELRCDAQKLIKKPCTTLRIKYDKRARK